MTPRHSQPRLQGHQSGFALVLALMLMAFILLLLLSMTTLVQVESRAATNSLEQLRARESARLALMLAIGELQKHAGPDQRVTARAEILGDGNYAPAAKFWTGVWDTTDPSAEPTWLVSGANADPANLPTSVISLEEAFDANSNKDITEDGDFSNTQIEFITTDAQATRYAWWISDEGAKAPVSVTTELTSRIEALEDDSALLDYNLRSKEVLSARHDPVFDYDLFFDIDDDNSTVDESLEIALSSKQVELLIGDKTSNDQNQIKASFLHDFTLRNEFVFSNPLHGGLKKDLSLLKTLDATTSTQAEIDSTFEEPNGLLTPDAIKLIQFRGNPTAYPTDEIMGMQIEDDTIAAANARVSHFNLTPVITEFQLSLGIATDGGNVSNSTITDSPIHIIQKVYIELWNPYTIPILIGDDTMADSRGFSDLRVEIKNLPSFLITNNGTGDTGTGSIPDIDILWSDHHTGPKILRPGMVYRTSLPLDPSSSGDPHGTNNSGTIQTILPEIIRGSRSDDYTGTFHFGGAPIEISLIGLNASGTEREIEKTEISGYSDFTIHYNYNSYNNRATWLKRVPTSSTGAWGMNTQSLEVQGYAFAFRYRMLDEQEVPGPITDISNWLSQYDIRTHSISADLNTWSLNNAWDTAPALPYDFRLNDIDTDLGGFDPSQSFKSDDFFHYETGTTLTGRRDRIARVIDLPTSEVLDVGVFRALKFRDHHANSLGNPWGNELNQFYDQYFFSTLPAPDTLEWDSTTPLANNRIKRFKGEPQLTDAETASEVTLENGFNLNSTSAAAWKSVLSGKQFPAQALEFQYEQSISSDAPARTQLTESLDNLFINNPHSIVHNNAEQASAPSYQFIARETTSDYLNAFSINNTTWLNILQYPAFYQSLRELTDADLDALSTAIVDRIVESYSTNSHPAFSMAEFLNEGILQDAIDRVPAINNRSSDADAIPPHSPAYISQATLMNALGPLSFVRSDTFKVRAYGCALNSATNKVESETYLEATLQRTPDAHSNAQFGREFEIIDLKWIPPVK
ncbi:MULTISPECIES: hypothetical protein [unclassified Lentimonas]|uniref:hypothetical protein n=1 Tax=unclassified Lentimonas TaxID=2630993 RepID=UPI00132239FA|nr:MULTISPECIES: hypothetical protein [unclassified Lentimonas]CAA6692020.1 Unannotated [Lentimonas sp. CC10]CAA6694047.1 Unannotated [Lentimonas sp. CC19]CAA7070291.1 Unannotated [Lentimonas sp. CC11]